MDQGKPLISILIVAYNSADLISACINSIDLACAGGCCEVLLVDNGDGATEVLVARDFPSVRIVPSQGNIGFSAGNNLLAEQAQGKYLLLLNPDVVLKPGAIDHLRAAASTYSAASAWGGVTLDRNDQPDLGNSVHVPSLREMASRLLGRSIAGSGAMIGVNEDALVDALSGSFVMVDRAAWDEVGGLDERYFLYCEEVDLFYRLARRGRKFWRIGAARAFHNIGHGDVLIASRMLYRAAGTMQFVRLHWSRPKQAMAFGLLWLAAWQRLVMGSLVGRWMPRLRTLGEGHRDMALRPNHWRCGYDRKRGLLAKIRERNSPRSATRA